MLINMYGITETTVHVTYRRIRQQDLEQSLGSVIGEPIPDLRLYLLDENLQPVPRGVPGEICVSGGGVARGYLNRAELTGQRFIPDPFSGVPQPMYRSGDLARRTWNGELEYLGRIDQQVKIRGFRVELGEIESVLNSHPGVRESAVVADTTPSGDARLVAYIVPQGAIPDRDDLRRHSLCRLPEYMVPAVFMSLEKLPLTSNGKIDRRALPAPKRDVTGSRVVVAPTSPTQTLLVQIWQELLGCQGIGIEDNFFHLGGHSLLATQVISRIAAALDIEVPVSALFEAPTVAELSRVVEQAKREGAAQARAPRTEFNPAHAEQLLAQLDELTDLEVEALLGSFSENRLS